LRELPDDRERGRLLASTPLIRTRKERKVAIVVMLFPVSDQEPKLQPGALEKLARLGVTSVALLRDGSGAGLVLEGWAFDPGDAPRAARAVGDGRADVRLLQPLVQMTVSTDAAPSGDRKG
jgi:hypothetical protein